MYFNNKFEEKNDKCQFFIVNRFKMKLLKIKK